jgi:hypothetical protein
MKTFCKTAMIVVFLLICTNGIQAQTTQTKLNQVELIKQFIGHWKCELGEDTTVTSVIKSYGIGVIEAYQTTLFKNKILSEEKSLWGYDKKNDKYLCARVWKANPEVLLMEFRFTSKNTCERILFECISNPERATSKAIYEFKSKDVVIKTDIVNNKVTKTNTFHREK